VLVNKHTKKNHFHRQNRSIIIRNYVVLITARERDKKEWAAITVQLEYGKLLGDAVKNSLMKDPKERGRI